jgi:hypothetical protein
MYNNNNNAVLQSALLRTVTHCNIYIDFNTNFFPH